MQMHASTGCVLMASGLSTRFGSNKLLAPFDGQPLLYRAFAATDTPQLSARIVVTRSAQVQALCKAQGCQCSCMHCPVGTIPCGWDFRRCWHSIRN